MRKWAPREDTPLLGSHSRWQVPTTREGPGVKSSSPHSHTASVLRSLETSLGGDESGEPQASDSLHRAALFPQEGVPVPPASVPFLMKTTPTFGDHIFLLVTYTSLGSSPQPPPPPLSYQKTGSFCSGRFFCTDVRADASMIRSVCVFRGIPTGRGLGPKEGSQVLRPKGHT